MSSSYEIFRRTRTFSAFDGLRGLLSIMIVWCHATGTLYEYGYMSLSTFFLISGFLITTLLLREREQHGEISLKLFYIRRTLRIFPLYYTIIAVYVITVSLLETDAQRSTDFFNNIPYFLTYTSNLFINDDPRVGMIFFFCWSLATEEQFYLVWPWIERYSRGKGPIIAAVALIALDQAASAGLLVQWISPEHLPHRIITQFSTPICLGVVLAHLLHSRRGYEIASRFIGGRWSSLISLGLVIAGMQIMPFDAFAQEMLLLAFVASCVMREDHHLNKILSLHFAMRLGVISYGTYLMHMLAINAARRVLGSLQLESMFLEFAIGYTLAVSMAAISYHYYESYFLSLKDRFTRKVQPTVPRLDLITEPRWSVPAVAKPLAATKPPLAITSATRGSAENLTGTPVQSA